MSYELPISPPPWLGVALMLGTSRLLVAGAVWHRKSFRPRPEVSRKALHIAMGTLFMALPWLFHQAWPVVGLCAMYVTLLLARRLIPSIDCGVAGVIYGVPRNAGGEFWFPIAVAILFIAAEGNRVRFCAPLALLTYADAAAAIIGVRYGTIRFRLIAGEKSLEGSAAFFIVALFCIQLSLNLLTPIPPLPAWRSSAVIAAITTLLELISPSGFDNLLIPLTASLLLLCLTST